MSKKRKNPFAYNRGEKHWLAFPNGNVGFWGFRKRENAEKFTGPSPTGGGQITIVKAMTREQAQEVVNGTQHERD